VRDWRLDERLQNCRSNYPALFTSCCFDLYEFVQDGSGIEISDWNFRNISGNTPLHVAAIYGSCGVLEVLLANPIVLITDEVVEAAARNLVSGKDMMTLLLNQRGDDVKVTEEVVKEAVRSGGKDVMMLLLDQRGDEVKITEEVVKEAAQNHGNDMMMLLLDRRGDEVKITEEVVRAAARYGGKDVMMLLLDKRIDDVKNIEELVTWIAMYFGEDMMTFLLDRRGDIKVTEEVVKAAAKNVRAGSDVMMLLLDKRIDDVKNIEELVTWIAMFFGEEVMTFLLDRRGDIKVTEEVLKAAAWNKESRRDNGRATAERWQVHRRVTF
jgi:hypothetical protein